jgi:hypothetical protein
MAIATVTTNIRTKPRSERRLRTRLRSKHDRARPFWLVAGQIGVILRDVTHADLDAFFRLPVEMHQVAIEIAENLEIMFGRCDIDDAGWSYRFDVARRTQSVVQDILLTGLCVDELEPLLGSLRKCVRTEQARRAA